MKSNIVFIILFIFFISNALARTLNESLIILKKKATQSGNIEISKSSVRKGIKKSFLNINFEINKALYKLEVIFPVTEKEFQSERNNLSAVIRQSYEDQPTPYSGEITNTTKCPAIFKPVALNEQAGSMNIYILKTLTGKDFSYGLCNEKEIAYSNCTSFYYDQSTMQFFKMNIYVLPTLACEKLTKTFVKNLSNI